MYSIAKSTVFRVERVKCNLEQETVYFEQVGSLCPVWLNAKYPGWKRLSVCTINIRNIMLCVAKSKVSGVERVKCVYYEH